MGGALLIKLGVIELENGFDVYGLEGALDIAVLQLLEELGPRVPSAEVEAKLREILLGFGEGKLRDGEVETAGVGEPKFIKWDGCS